MPKLDSCHAQVVNALEKAGWLVSMKQYPIRVPTRVTPLFADIKARRGQDTIIVAEIKCFERGIAEEVYTAIGQYLVYRAMMRQLGISHPLYLAIPLIAYRGIFQQLGRDVVRETTIKLIVVDIEREVIESWLE